VGDHIHPSAQQSPPSGAISIPDHVLIRRIGRGSYGEVWLARNSMGAYRAVKIVRRASFEESRPFQREVSGIRAFEPISRSHEGFIDILHVGIDEEKGIFYYVMELGDDCSSEQTVNPDTYFPKTLSREIMRAGRLSPRECLELGLALTLALAELHKRGLVHRDIKPSNIIFVNGVAKLADIGLVAETKQPISLVGTEGFMPPEGPGTPQADVYSLGKVFYEASTGNDRMRFPELPTLLFAAPEHQALVEFNEVIARACDARPARRYQSAWEMHAELVVLANGKSVRRLRKLERLFSRLKHAAAVAALFLVVFGTLAFEVDRQWRSASEAREREVGASLAYGNRSMQAGDLLGALPYYARALELEKGCWKAELPYRLRFASTLAQCPKLVQTWALAKQVESVSFDTSGKWVLTVEQAGRAQVFEATSGQPMGPPFGQPTQLRQGTFDPDGRLVATASEDGTVCIWRVDNGTNLLTLKHPDKAVCASFSPDGNRIVTGCDDGVARIWNSHTGALELELKGHTDCLLFAAFSGDGRRIVTTSRDHTARIWDAKTGRMIGAPLWHATWVEYAAFSPDGKLLVTACADRTARVWDLNTMQEIPPALYHEDIVRSAEFSPDGRLILTACLDGTVRLWQAKNHQPLNLNPILRLPDRVTDATFGPDGHRILASCTDGSVWMWDLAGSAVAPKAMHNRFSQDDSRYLVKANDTLEVFDTSSGSPISRLSGSLANSSAVRLNQNGRFVVASLLRNEPKPRAVVEIWDVQTGKREGPPLALTNSPDQLLLSNDGHTLVAFSGKLASTWNVRDSAPLARMAHNENITSVALNPAGTVVASWSGGAVKVWKSSTGQELFPPLSHPFPVTHVEFSPDSSRLVTCGADTGFTKCYAQVWDAATGRAVCPPLYHRDGVLWAAFSPDGTRVVTGGEDFVARVWDASTGRPITPPLRHSSVVLQAAFSRDGKWVVTASPDRTVRIWSAETGDPLTPPLWHQTKVVDARFLADGRQVVTLDKEGDHRIWKLPVDQRPVPDLLRLARLLSDESPGDAAPLQVGQSLQSLWLQLRAKYPFQFRVTREELAAWHDSQARGCELDHDSFAARFHLKCLLSLRPKDKSVAERLALAERHLSHNR
jgi:WD40 repeat protein